MGQGTATVTANATNNTISVDYTGAGDPTVEGQPSGLAEALDLLDTVEGIAQCYFSEDDVVRHELVGRIVRAYEAATRSGEHSAPHMPRRMRES